MKASLRNTLVGCLAWLVLLPFQVSLAGAAELVVNGGFETGNFLGWSGGITSYPTDVIVTESQPYNSLQAVHSGTYSLFFGNSGSTRDLTQTLPTVSGTDYTISFWVNALGVVPNELQLFWSSTSLVNLQNFGTDGWTQYIFTELATTDATTLTFLLRQDPSYSALDDISVTGPSSATPLPPALPLLASGLSALGLLSWRMKRKGSQ
jgi:hypothetical protein